MFEFDILEVGNDMEIQTIGKKTVYNTDGKVSLSDWIKKIKLGKTFDFPQVSSSLIIKNQNGRGRMTQNSFGYFLNNANNVNENDVNVSLFTTPTYKGNGTSITVNNLFRVLVSFCSRKAVISSWINSKDEYLAPNEIHTDFEQFKYDSLIYSLFNSASNQSSLRQVEYKDKFWDIKNEFFWMSVDEMTQIAEKTLH